MVTIISKDICPYCDMAKGLLTSLGIEYSEINVSSDLDRLSEIVSITGMMTVPQIFNGEISKDNLLGGYDDIMELNDKGELVGICK